MFNIGDKVKLRMDVTYGGTLLKPKGATGIIASNKNSYNQYDVSFDDGTFFPTSITVLELAHTPKPPITTMFKPGDIVEIIDSGCPIGLGAVGKVICTSNFQGAMPLTMGTQHYEVDFDQAGYWCVAELQIDLHKPNISTTGGPITIQLPTYNPGYYTPISVNNPYATNIFEGLVGVLHSIYGDKEKCECGAHKCGSDSHSSWCPLSAKLDGLT